MSPALEFLLGPNYSGALHPAHLADLKLSGLSEDTVAQQRIRSVPITMIRPLLGFEAPKVESACLIPFPDPRGGWMNHVRMKVFPPHRPKKGGTVKYLQPKDSGVRIYFPLATLDAVLRTADTLYIVEGEKKALAVAQLGVPSVGLCGIEGWHAKGARSLHPDFDDVGLAGRTVKVIPDADVRTNPAVATAVRGLGWALAGRGAAAELVHVPAGYKGIDDWLVAAS